MCGPVNKHIKGFHSALWSIDRLKYNYIGKYKGGEPCNFKKYPNETRKKIREVTLF